MEERRTDAENRYKIEQLRTAVREAKSEEEYNAKINELRGALRWLPDEEARRKIHGLTWTPNNGPLTGLTTEKPRELGAGLDTTIPGKPSKSPEKGSNLLPGGMLPTPRFEDGVISNPGDVPLVPTLIFSKGDIHHICTDKNCKSTARGEPWTPRFEPIFEEAGMSLQDAANKVIVPGHKGPHPEAYHQTVPDRLNKATRGKTGEDYGASLRRELGAISNEAQKPGTKINKLLTKK